VGQHSSASGSALLDLHGLEVLAVDLVAGDWQIAVQTTATVVGCIGCGCGPPCMAAARSGCVTWRSVAARSCWPGARTPA
jgi:hypothetical protein